jgi:hypothetical protein
MTLIRQKTFWAGLVITLLLAVTLAACGENTATPVSPATIAATTAAPGGGTSTGATTPGTGAGNALNLAYPNVVRKTSLTYDETFPGLGSSKDVSYFQAFVTEDPPEKVQQYYSDLFGKLGFSVTSGSNAGQYEVLAQRSSTTLQAIVVAKDQPVAQRQDLKGAQNLVAVIMRDSNAGKVLGPKPSPTT